MIRLALSSAALVFAASLAFAQEQQSEPKEAGKAPEFVWPDRMQNAKALQADIGAQWLQRTMLGFSTSLGVRCTHCHVGENGAELSSLNFASDANPRKDIAREMIRMTARINNQLLPGIAGLESPQVSCFSCHRGAITPETIPPMSEGAR